MPKFSYIATNGKGSSVRGSVSAASKNELIKMLGSQGLFLVSSKIDDMGTAPSYAPPPASPNTHSNASTDMPMDSLWAKLNKKSAAQLDLSKKPKGKVTLKELVVVTRQ